MSIQRHTYEEMTKQIICRYVQPSRIFKHPIPEKRAKMSSGQFCPEDTLFDTQIPFSTT